MELKVLLTDAHTLLAEAVASVLQDQNKYSVTIASSLDEAVEAISTHSFHVVLLDVDIPGMSGFHGLKVVNDLANGARTVLFSGRVERRFLRHALELGVYGFIPKNMALKSLGSAIRLIAAGERFLPTRDSDSIIDNAVPDFGLTERDATVLDMASSGWTNKEIAEALDVSEMAIKMTIRSICKKLDARNRAHATKIGITRGLI